MPGRVPCSEEAPQAEAFVVKLKLDAHRQAHFGIKPTRYWRREVVVRYRDRKSERKPMTKDLREIKEHICKVVARCGAIPEDADIVLRDIEGWETAVHCTWKAPTPTALGGSKVTRAITLQLTGVATMRFLEADEKRLMHLDSRLSDIVRNRLRQGYRETESDTGPFIISLDDHDFDE